MQEGVGDFEVLEVLAVHGSFEHPNNQNYQ